MVGYGELDVVSVGADPAGRGAETDAFCCEDGFGVALAEGAEQLQLADALIAELGQGGDCVDVELIDAVLIEEVQGSVIFEVVGKSLDVFGLYCDTRCPFVAAEGDEVF